ncbi:MAG: serine/threonine protein kinase, partial [Planctomycetes bacterium]|nr:serine/threonine protein kinase [Planctomycetota bacterium]
MWNYLPQADRESEGAPPAHGQRPSPAGRRAGPAAAASRDAGRPRDPVLHAPQRHSLRSGPGCSRIPAIWPRPGRRDERAAVGETPTRPHVLGGDPIPELPDLRLLRCVGKGAYGAVWLAENRTTGKLLAVKVIPRKAVGPGDRVGRELKALIHFEAGLGSPHENVLTVHHVGQTDDFLFYTMDPADNVGGGAASTEPGYRPATLAARLEGSALPPHECLALARQLLAGLAHLHAAGLAHRDVKPSNCVFVGGKLKVADVGLVTPSDATASAIGTPMYMPPDGRMDARADVYAAGLTVYEMLTGLPAHQF